MIEHHYDIVIVGSGAGGGTVAKELAPLCREGVRIAVLEWGPKWRQEEMTGRELEMARRLYFDGGGTMTRDRSLTVAAARAYGGSTTVYTGTSLFVPERVIRSWGVPGLEWEDVRRRSELYAGENGVHLLPGELINENNTLFVEGCRRLGWPVHQFPLNIRGCRGAGVCNLGCPNGAKQGTHVVQLPAAEAGGVEVITNARVESIGEGECRVVVKNPGFGEPSPWEEGEHRVRAAQIVAAAGGLRSPALLLHSGLGKGLPALGRWITLHPALILVAEQARPITNIVGHPKSYYCDSFQEKERFLLETCMYYPFTTAKNLIGFGADHSALMRRFDRMQQILVLVMDRARKNNRIDVDHHGDPVIDYTLSDDVLDSFHAAMKAAVRIFLAAGALRVHVPAATQFTVTREDLDTLDRAVPRRMVQPGRLSVSSAHPMGGCRMGAGPEDSVTDGWGRVHGVPGLYVADASLFPSCSEVNPYLTVMALAGRVAEAVRNDRREVTAA